jgi:hypothetical protein
MRLYCSIASRINNPCGVGLRWGREWGIVTQVQDGVPCRGCVSPEVHLSVGDCNLSWGRLCLCALAPKDPYS